MQERARCHVLIDCNYHDFRPDASPTLQAQSQIKSMKRLVPPLLQQFKNTAPAIARGFIFLRACRAIRRLNYELNICIMGISELVCASVLSSCWMSFVRIGQARRSVKLLEHNSLITHKNPKRSVEDRKGQDECGYRKEKSNTQTGCWWNKASCIQRRY